MPASGAARAWRAVPLLVMLGACHALTGPDAVVYGLRPAEIDPRFGAGVGEVLVADSVAAGEPLTVVVRSAGGGCTRKGETRVAAPDIATAEVLPLDSVPVRTPANFGCTRELRVFVHQAVVRFDRRGAATVRVRGRSRADGEREVVLERAVRVY